MAKNIKNIETRKQNGKTDVKLVSPDELKSLVRDGLVAMSVSEREGFIKVLETEMRKSGLNMRSYLIPLGIPARTLEELTPTEVGHLVRYLKVNVTQAIPAIERALATYNSFVERRPGDRLAA